MVNIKKGFTLAEILITLGIIAVSRAITILSQGFEAYIYGNDSKTIFSADPTVGKTPVEIFKRLQALVWMKIDESTTSPPIKESVTGGDIIASGGGTLFVFRDKSAVLIPPDECNPNRPSKDAELPRCKFYFLPLGWMKKDILLIGEDAFELAYNNNGAILIYGLDYGDLWTSNCSDSQVESFTPASNKHSCGGRIAAHGFKKDY